MLNQAETRAIKDARTEKARLEAEIEADKETLSSAATLLEQAKAVHQACLEAEATISKLADKKTDPFKVPDFDQAALEALEETLAAK